MGADEVDALLICAPNDTRVDMMRTIHGQVKAGQAQLLGVACEKPLARTIAEGREVIIETTTSWAYVGSGLRIQLELLGPEYSMEFSSLNTGLKIFLSRAVTGAAGEDMVEKQNAEQGLMPVLEDEAGIYGYTDEDRHMVEAPNMLLGDVAVPDERLKATTVGRAQDDADSWAHEPDSHTESPAGIPLGIQMSDFIH